MKWLYNILKCIGLTHHPFSGKLIKPAIDSGELSTLKGSFLRTKQEKEFVQTVLLDLEKHKAEFLREYQRSFNHHDGLKSHVDEVKVLLNKHALAFAQVYNGQIFVVGDAVLNAKSLATSYFLDTIWEMSRDFLNQEGPF